MDLQRKGWVRVKDGAGQTSSSSSSSSNTSSGERTPPPKGPQTQTPPKAPKKKPPFDSSEEDAPPPKPSSPSQGPRPSPSARARARPAPPPQAPSPLQDCGWDPYGNVERVGDTRYVHWAEGDNGGTVSQVTVLGDWDEDLDPGEWLVVSQGSNGEREKGKKRKREKEGGTFRVPGELLFRTQEEAEARLREAFGGGGRRR